MTKSDDDVSRSNVPDAPRTERPRGGDRAETLFRKAHEAHNNRDHEEAAAIYRHVIRDHPNSEFADKAQQQLRWLRSSTHSRQDDDSASNQTTADEPARQSDARSGTGPGGQAASERRGNEPQSPEKRFGVLRLISVMFKGLGVVVGLSGLVSIFLVFDDFGIAAIMALLPSTAFWVLMCFAFGEGIQVFLAIEENTRA